MRKALLPLELESSHIFFYYFHDFIFLPFQTLIQLEFILICSVKSESNFVFQVATQLFQYYILRNQSIPPLLLDSIWIKYYGMEPQSLP